MKQIKYLLLLAVIFMADSISAQNVNQARTCLDKATAIVANQGGVTARFALSRPGSVGRTSGTISVKGTKFVATTPQMTIWFNGKTQWSYMKSTNEVNISTPTALDESLFPDDNVPAGVRSLDDEQGQRLSGTHEGS